MTVGYMLTSGLGLPLLFFTCRNFTVSVIQDFRSIGSKEIMMTKETMKLAEDLGVEPSEIFVVNAGDAQHRLERLDSLPIVKQEEEEILVEAKRLSDGEEIDTDGPLPMSQNDRQNM
jgi:hypothetical protein